MLGQKYQKIITVKVRLEPPPLKNFGETLIRLFMLLYDKSAGFHIY